MCNAFRPTFSLEEAAPACPPAETLLRRRRQRRGRHGGGLGTRRGRGWIDFYWNHDAPSVECTRVQCAVASTPSPAGAARRKPNGGSAEECSAGRLVRDRTVARNLFLIDCPPDDTRYLPQLSLTPKPHQPTPRSPYTKDGNLFLILIFHFLIFISYPLQTFLIYHLTNKHTKTKGAEY